MLERLANVFDSSNQPKEALVDVKTLHTKIGELTLENDLLVNKAGLLSEKR